MLRSVHSVASVASLVGRPRLCLAHQLWRRQAQARPCKGKPQADRPAPGMADQDAERVERLRREAEAEMRRSLPDDEAGRPAKRARTGAGAEDEYVEVGACQATHTYPAERWRMYMLPPLLLGCGPDPPPLFAPAPSLLFCPSHKVGRFDYQAVGELALPGGVPGFVLTCNFRRWVLDRGGWVLLSTRGADCRGLLLVALQPNSLPCPPASNAGCRAAVKRAQPRRPARF